MVMAPLPSPGLPDAADVALRTLAASGLDLTRWGHAVARVLPSALLVPAFGLGALPAPMRVVFGMAIAASVAPGLVIAPGSAPLSWARDLSAGLPVAVSAATALWVAGMVGTLADDPRHTRTPQSFPLLEGGHGPLGVLFGLAGSIAFLELGGPARLAHALSAARPLDRLGAETLALGLARGIQIAVSIAAPLLLLSLILQTVNGLVSRSARLPHWPTAAAPIEPVLRLLLLLLLLDRLLERLVTLIDLSLGG